MQPEELKEQLEVLDGVQKAQMLVLRALLRDQPRLRDQLRAYAEQLPANPPAEDLTPIQIESMAKHLLSLAQ